MIFADIDLEMSGDGPEAADGGIERHDIISGNRPEYKAFPILRLINVHKHIHAPFSLTVLDTRPSSSRGGPKWQDGTLATMHSVQE